MKTKLVIEEIRKGAENRVLGSLSEGEVLVGRDPTCGIPLQNTAVSRQHGVFQQFKDHWLYKDLGSTNGSWLNGLPLGEGQWRIVRTGDLMQLADIAVKIGLAPGESEERDSSRTLLVFANGNFLEEYPIPDIGHALSIGASGTDLMIEGVADPKASLTIDRQGRNVCALQHGLEGEAFVNEEPIVEISYLSDRDVVRLQQYTVILHDPDRGSDTSDPGWEESDDPWADDN